MMKKCPEKRTHERRRPARARFGLRYTPGMGTSLLVPGQEYLTASYQPDGAYDDGGLLERNAGEQLRTETFHRNPVAQGWCEPGAQEGRQYPECGVGCEAKDGVPRAADPAMEVPLAALLQALDD